MTLDAAMKPRSYILEMDKDATATVFKINVTSPGTYGIFAEVCPQQLPASIVPMAPVTSFSCPFAGQNLMCPSCRMISHRKLRDKSLVWSRD